MVTVKSSMQCSAGGHAAHFANIDQGSPMFSQERAPTSVAYAENQSMLLDSFIDDAAWKGRYALSRCCIIVTPLNLQNLTASLFFQCTYCIEKVLQLQQACTTQALNL